MQKIFWMMCAGAVTLAVWLALATGCKPTAYANNPNYDLRFSADTIVFDTVFTTVGSVTLPLKVYNDHPEPILISEVSLEGGAASQFRMNVDGSAGTELQDVPLLPGDSLYIFVEVTVDPNADDAPFVVEDQIRFLTNNNPQHVMLVAWGQNAIFHGRSAKDFTVLDCATTWTPELPHVVYGIVEVPQGCELTILPGTEVYVHPGGGLLVYQSTLTADGTLENPITFQGDRLDDNYAELPGSWGIEFDVSFGPESELFTVARGGVWLYGSVNSRMNHCQLRYGAIGLQVDTLGAPDLPALTLTNSVISDMSGIGLLAQGAHIEGYNNLVYDCGQACAALTIGGVYRLDHCTFANYSADGVRQAPCVLLNDWYRAANGTDQIRTLSGSRLTNCIIWGNNAMLDNFDELIADLADPPAEPLIVHSAVDVQDSEFPMQILGPSTLLDAEPPFASTPDRDFHLTGNSSLWEGGAATFPIAVDLDGLPRIVGAPDMGCYERQ